MRSVAARTSGIEATVRSGATSPFSCSNLPAATSSGSIHGVVASFMLLLPFDRVLAARAKGASLGQAHPGRRTGIGPGKPPQGDRFPTPLAVEHRYSIDRK